MNDDNYQANLINTYDPAIKSKVTDSFWVCLIMGAFATAGAVAIMCAIGACVR